MSCRCHLGLTVLAPMYQGLARPQAESAGRERDWAPSVGSGAVPKVDSSVLCILSNAAILNKALKQLLYRVTL